ncbi:MAG: TIGR00730 family Rossman fold protein, partial [Campylobacteraceae bacterium]|nr:TIGR00730 family Rossman fold protein [Campylobacteraceae bacterium]
MKNSEFDKSVSLTDSEYINEYVEDYNNSCKLLEDIGATVAVFGSARFDENNIYYKQAVEVSKKLAQNGFHIITGGSGGIMEAANRGAYKVGDAHSIGFNLYLPFEQLSNNFATIKDTLNSFSVRKHMLLKNSTSCVVLPG